MAMKLWMIILPVSIVVLIIIILLAILIPRPVPCDDYKPRIDYIAQTGTDRYNASLISEARNVVCVPRGADSTDSLQLWWSGRFMTSTPETSPRPPTSPKSGTNPPIFTWDGAKINWANIEQIDCKDLEVWMRPGVLSCKGENMTVSARGLTESVETIEAKVEHDVPCEGDKVTITVTALSESLIDLQANTVAPSLLCIGAGPYTVAISGKGFLFVDDGETMHVPYITYDGVSVDPNMTLPVLTSCVNISVSQYPEILSCTNMTVSIPNQDSTNSLADLSVVNSFPCTDDAVITDAFVYTRGTVQVFASAPDVLYNDISFQIALYVSGLSGTNLAEKIIFENSNDGNVWETTSARSQGGQVFVDVPLGVLSPGLYDILIEATNDPVGCSGRLIEGMNVVDQATLTIDSIEPRYVYVQDEFTPVTIRASGGGIVDTPSVYISSPTGDSLALSAVQWIDSDTLTAVVVNANEFFSPGDYDIVVVNPSPDNSVGVLEGVYTIIANPKPLINTVTPTGLLVGNTVTITITGDHFSNSSITLDCLGGDGTPLGISQTTNNVVVSPTEMTFTAPLLAERVFCAIILTNDDAVFTIFSGINYKPSNGDPIQPILQSNTISVARRQNAVAQGLVTSASRVLNVIGGDTENALTFTSPVNALDSVESASVSILGVIGPFTDQRNTLPAPCTYSDSATVGRYIYLLCSHNGTDAVSTIYRAHVLSPLAAPRLDLEISVVEGNTTGIFGDGGSWQYRVSPVFAVDDEFNPAGEGLSGEPLSIKLPEVLDAYFEMSLSWEAVPGAVSYNVYRTVLSPSRVSDIGLLINVNTNSFTDDGEGAFADDTQTPNPQGSLGNWAMVKSLNSERAWGDLNVAPHPSNANEYFLFAFGGMNAAGSVLDTYEHSLIVITSQNGLARETQTMADWTEEAGNTLNTARMGLDSVVFPASAVPNLVDDGKYYVTVGPGLNAGNIAVDGMDVAEITSDGVLTFLSVQSGPNDPNTGTQSGYCLNNYIGDGQLGNVFYGENGRSGAYDVSNNCSNGADCLKTVFNNFGNSLNNDNINAPDGMGALHCARTSPFLLFAGGYNPGTSAVTSNVYSIW